MIGSNLEIDRFYNVFWESKNLLLVNGNNNTVTNNLFIAEAKRINQIIDTELPVNSIIPVLVANAKCQII